MDIILQATDLQKFDGQVFVGYGTLLNGKKTGIWNYGPIISKGNNCFEIHHLNKIEWSNGTPTSVTSVNLAGIKRHVTISEYIGDLVTRKISFSSAITPATTVETVSLYTEIDTRHEVKEISTCCIDRYHDDKLIKLREYKEIDEDNFCSKSFSSTGKVISEEICNEGNIIFRRYFSLESSRWSESLHRTVEKYPWHFEDLIIEEKHNKKTITSYCCQYNELRITTDDTDKFGTGYRTITVIEHQSWREGIVKRSCRFYYKDQRIGITQEYSANITEKTLPLTKSYFSFGNRKIDIAELGIKDNTEIDDSVVTFLKLKYK